MTTDIFFLLANNREPITIYLETLPDASPPISFSTSSIVTWLKSPLMVCLRQDAATRKIQCFLIIAFIGV
jgi:hypothetical protein